MNKTIKLIGMIAFIAILAFSIVACDNGGGGGTPNPNPPPPPSGITVPGNNLEEKLQWITDNAEDNKTYIIDVTQNEAFADTYRLNKNATVILRGGNAMRTISLKDTTNKYIFALDNGTLILENNITLDGKGVNDGVGINDGTLEMKNGAVIKNAVYVGVHITRSDGTFTMSGGTIMGCGQAGVYGYDGTFNMSGGEISSNNDVGVTTSTNFNMTGGTITNNTAGNGGGVSIHNGTFTMSGGEISGNTHDHYYGGGVAVHNATFTMSGGKISGNTSSAIDGDGGGVCVATGTFTMDIPGKIKEDFIYGNNATNGNGPNVYVYSSGTTFKVNGNPEVSY